jgi:EMAP domain
MTISFEDFEKIDMRIGTIMQVEDSLSRKPTYRFTLDFGPEIGIRKSCAALTRYAKEELVGRHIVAVVNFPPKKMGPEVSEVLILGVPDGNGGVIHLQPEQTAQPGVRVF